MRKVIVLLAVVSLYAYAGIRDNKKKDADLLWVLHSFKSAPTSIASAWHARRT